MNRMAKKNPTRRSGWEAFLLSHIKAPAQGGKAGSSKLPTRNLAKWRRAGKKKMQIYSSSSLKVDFSPQISPSEKTKLI